MRIIVASVKNRAQQFTKVIKCPECKAQLEINCDDIKQYRKGTPGSFCSLDLGCKCPCCAEEGKLTIIPMWWKDFINPETNEEDRDLFDYFDKQEPTYVEDENS